MTERNQDQVERWSSSLQTGVWALQTTGVKTLTAVASLTWHTVSCHARLSVPVNLTDRTRMQNVGTIHHHPTNLKVQMSGRWASFFLICSFIDVPGRTPLWMTQTFLHSATLQSSFSKLASLALVAKLQIFWPTKSFATFQASITTT